MRLYLFRYILHSEVFFLQPSAADFMLLSPHRRHLVLVHNGVDLQTIVLTPEQSQEYEIVFPYERYQEGCFWFALIKEERASQSRISGCYAGEIEQEKFR